MFHSAKIRSYRTVNTDNFFFFKLRKSEFSEIVFILYMFTDAICPIHAAYSPPALDLKQHFPVRVISEMVL